MTGKDNYDIEIGRHSRSVGLRIVLGRGKRVHSPRSIGPSAQATESRVSTLRGLLPDGKDSRNFQEPGSSPPGCSPIGERVLHAFFGMRLLYSKKLMFASLSS